MCYNIDGDVMKRKYLLIVLLIILGVFIFTGCEKKEKTKLIENKDYFVRGSFTGQYLDIKKRGYYIDTYNEVGAPYLYIICMGEQSSGGYSLEIKEVNRIDNKTEIIVKEIVPSKHETVTTWFTSPTIIVEFPNYQEDITIKNTIGEEFNELKGY